MNSKEKNISPFLKTATIIAVLCFTSFVLKNLIALILGNIGMLNTNLLVLLSNGIITLTAILLPFAVGNCFLKVSLLENTDKRKIYKMPVNSAGIVLFGFSACVVINFITSLLSELIPSAGGSNVSSDGNGNNAVNVLLMFTVFALLPAICEEIAFRGIVMGSLMKYGNKIAVIGSAFCFAVLHNSVSVMLFAFLCGLVFGVIRIKTGSVIPSVIVHFLNNALSVAMSVLMPIMTMKAYLTAYYAVVLVSVIATAVGMILLYKNRKS